MKKILITTFISILTIFAYSQNSKNISKFEFSIIDSIKSKSILLYRFSKEWIGLPYKMGGTSKSGIDCSAFSKTLYQNVYNIKIPRTAAQQYNFVKKIKKSELISGDLIFFKGKSWHVGVYLSNGYFIHASNKKTGVKISSLTSNYYTSVYLSGGRI